MLPKADSPEAAQNSHSPARAALSAAQEALEGARSHLEELHRPLSALERVLIAAESAEAAELRNEIGRLLAAPDAERKGCTDGDRSGEMLFLASESPEAEQRLAKLAKGAADAGHRLAAARKGYVAAAERVRVAAIGQEEALWPATVEAAQPDLCGLEQAVRGVLAIEARLRSLVLALRETGHRGKTGGEGAFSAAEKIEAKVADIRRQPTLAIDVEIGRSFIDRLRSDAGAIL
jgi:hypothetical protein